MSAQEVAQSVRRPFTGIIAPELPVGSPERAALFAEIRKTSTEDWAEAERAVEAERREKFGDLYFVQVGKFVKIGRTASLDSRLRMIDCHAPMPPKVLAIIKGGGWLEREVHLALRHLQSRGEWFRCSPDIEAEIARLNTLTNEGEAR